MSRRESGAGLVSSSPPHALLFLGVAPRLNMAPPDAASPAGKNGRRLPGAADFRRRPISWRAALKHRPPRAAAAAARPSRPASAACPRREPAA